MQVVEQRPSFVFFVPRGGKQQRSPVRLLIAS